MKQQPLPSTTNDATDLVFTPPEWAQAIVDALPLSGRVLDPSKGLGAFYDAFPSDCIKDWCEITEGRDFLSHIDPCDWIVTNPPWSQMRPFMDHAMGLAENVVFLVTTNHVFTRARVSLIEGKGFGIRGIYHVPTPPKPWPASGFQLSAVWLKRGWTGFTEIKHIEVQA